MHPTLRALPVAGWPIAEMGKIYLTLSDHYTTEPEVSQDPNTPFGKIIEIDIGTNKWRVFTKGHRNPQGLKFLKNGQLLSTEHGPRGGDELNVVTEGSNYGWPEVTLGTEYDSYDWRVGSSLVGSQNGYTAPLFAWVPSIAVLQLIEINNFHPRWDGDLLVGSFLVRASGRPRLLLLQLSDDILSMPHKRRVRACVPRCRAGSSLCLPIT
jgi:glucose/arabinose dehydrogenase